METRYGSTPTTKTPSLSLSQPSVRYGSLCSNPKRPSTGVMSSSLTSLSFSIKKVGGKPLTCVPERQCYLDLGPLYYESTQPDLGSPGLYRDRVFGYLVLVGTPFILLPVRGLTSKEWDIKGRTTSSVQGTQVPAL